MRKKLELKTHNLGNLGKNWNFEHRQFANWTRCKTDYPVCCIHRVAKKTCHLYSL